MIPSVPSGVEHSAGKVENGSFQQSQPTGEFNQPTFHLCGDHGGAGRPVVVVLVKPAEPTVWVAKAPALQDPLFILGTFRKELNRWFGVLG